MNPIQQAPDEYFAVEVVQLPSMVTDEVAQSWLTAQCGMINDTRLGVVLDTTDHGEGIQLLACWPNTLTTVPKRLIDAAYSALRENGVVIVSGDDLDGTFAESGPRTCFVAKPLVARVSTGPVAVFELPDSIRLQQQAVVQLLHWGAVWFDLLQSKDRSYTKKNHLDTIVKLLASSLEHPEFNAAAGTFASELATRFACSQVSLGLIHGSSVSVCAISNTARVDTRLNLNRVIGAAMNEAVDQDATLSWPPYAGGLPHATFAQEVLARHRGGVSVLTTPLYDGTNAIGALTLERDGKDGFDDESRTVCETLAVLLGPVLALKHEKEQSIIVKAIASLRGSTERLFGPRHVAPKLYTFLLIGLLAFMSFATGEYRITAKARVEGSVKRVVTAPGDGFIASATRRAGDVVEQGDVLARLDDQELLLEQLKLNSQREQLKKEHRAATTTHDRSAAAIGNSRMLQIDAQLALINEQLKRTHLRAPFAGMIVSGDLSQRIGSSVANGQVLFEVAPLDDYRVVLEVDERDIGDIANLQTGALTLTGLPDGALNFTVKRVVPLSTPREGRNVFEVQGELNAPTESIRPGMEGIAKIRVDQRKLIWVWTHELIDWLRLTLWTWIS